MTNWLLAIGFAVSLTGGILLSAIIIFFLGWLVQVAWVAFSNQCEQCGNHIKVTFKRRGGAAW